MPSLILVKHAMPEIDPAVPADRWPLSAAGRARCGPLADRLRCYRPEVLAGSPEPKALDTAREIGARLGLSVMIVPDLREHDRSNVPYLGDEASFAAAVAGFFASPSALMLGQETADAARERFVRAVDGILERSPGRTVAVVAHGTVISLFAAEQAGIEPFPLWQRLGLPSFIVLSLPDLAVLEIVGGVEAPAVPSPRSEAEPTWSATLRRGLHQAGARRDRTPN